MKLSTREQRIVIAGAAVVLVTLAVYFGDALLPSRSGGAGTLDQRKRTLLQYRETLALEELYKARLDQYRTRLQVDQKRLLDGENPSIAAADLQKILMELASQSGVEIQRRDIQRETRMQESLVKISVKIEVNCTPESLVKFVAAVENYEKFLSLDELQVTTFRMQKRYEIRPSITVTGYILSPEVKPEKAGN